MRWIYASIFLCTTIVVWSAANIMWSGNHYTGIIKADGKGYYAHLPAAFIYHDLNFGFFDSLQKGKYANNAYYYDYRKESNGKTINKYFVGTSIAMLPFFGIAQGVSYLTSTDLDGYSKWYQILISVAAISYLIITLYIMALAMRKLNFNTKLIALALPVIVFGTNWYYYVISEPAMSHVYSIFFISLFVYLGIKWGRGEGFRIYSMAILLGFIVLIRPVNGLIIFTTPLFFTSKSQFIEGIRPLWKRPWRSLLAMAFGLSIIGVQGLLYKLQTGSFMVYSYEQEGFNFSDPQIFNILFSYKKGLFLYTPILLLSLLGLVRTFRHNRWSGACLSGFLILLVYVLSSWWQWYYGGSFSSRVFIDYYILFLWPLLALFSSVSFKPKLKIATIMVVIFLVSLCQFQTFQYRHIIIHWDGMTKETYWDSFLSIERDDSRFDSDSIRNK